MTPSGGDWKAFFQAASEGDVELVRFYLDQGVDADFQHPEVMTTALIEASVQGHAQVVALLLGAGAKAEIRSMMDGWDALEAAVASEHPAVARLLAQHLGVPCPAVVPQPVPAARGVLGRLVASLLGTP